LGSNIYAVLCNTKAAKAYEGTRRKTHKKRGKCFERLAWFTCWMCPSPFARFSINENYPVDIPGEELFLQFGGTTRRAAGRDESSRGIGLNKSHLLIIFRGTNAGRFPGRHGMGC
jgi:hypothetical protein